MPSNNPPQVPSSTSSQKTSGTAGSTATDNPRRPDSSTPAPGGLQHDRKPQGQGNEKGMGKPSEEDDANDVEMSDSSETGASRSKPQDSKVDGQDRGGSSSSRQPQEEIIGTGGAGGKPGRTGDPGTKK